MAVWSRSDTNAGVTGTAQVPAAAATLFRQMTYSVGRSQPVDADPMAVGASLAAHSAPPPIIAALWPLIYLGPLVSSQLASRHGQDQVGVIGGSRPFRLGQGHNKLPDTLRNQNSWQLTCPQIFYGANRPLTSVVVHVYH
ncbi:hypothetical protein J3458_022449 [Metarhizium acridum]|uniref:uncharacterized protein n=1 Tax=Metarhizium acridum TaxID=92637 RepID=UPI001C6AE9B9|nr:hypothetical protein J3458_022449 [Metarhizium acridum]